AGARRFGEDAAPPWRAAAPLTVLRNEARDASRRLLRALEAHGLQGPWLREHGAQQSIVKCMSGFVRREVADRVEQLVADEFVGEAQALDVQHPVLVQHHGIVESAAQCKTAVAQILD